MLASFFFSILSLSIDANLRPKVEYLKRIGLADAPGGLGRQLDAYPALLTLSLEGNIAPTARALSRAGLLPGGADIRQRTSFATVKGGKLDHLSGPTQRQKPAGWVRGREAVTRSSLETASSFAAQ